MNVCEQFLQNHPFFIDLDKEEIGLIKSLLQEQKFDIGETIFQEGELSFDLYFLVEGEVSILKSDIDKESQSIIGKLQPNEIFGEMSFLDHAPRSTTLQAEKNTVVLRLLWEDAERSISKETLKKITANLMLINIGRLRNANQSYMKQLKHIDKVQEIQQGLLQHEKDIREALLEAASMQKKLLPPPELKLKNIHFSWLYEPYQVVGGDLINILPLNENHAAFYIVDVSGHDIASAIFTASIAQFIQQFNVSNELIQTPLQIINALQQEYPFERFEKYFTLFYLILELDTGKFLYSSAGHPPAVMIQRGHKPILLESSDVLIGLKEFSSPSMGKQQLQSGDKLFLYTDGITEIENTRGKAFGPDRLYSLLESCQNSSVEEDILKIKHAIKSFSEPAISRDDVSLLAVEFIK